MYHRIVYCTLIFCFDFQPFGEGLVTVTVPQLRRGEHSLSLWNIPNINSPMPNPVNTFVGHSDMVLEFQWRSQVQDGKPVQYGRGGGLKKGQGGGVKKGQRKGRRKGHHKESYTQMTTWSSSLV